LVSNPPYFPDHLKSSDHKRNLALHADALSFEELLMGADHLLHKQGEFWVILPERQMAELIVRSKVFSFQLFSKVDLKDRSDKSVLRVICGFSKSKRIFFQNEITIRDDSGKFNSDYAALLMDFLLIF
jgi:tRNA1Val (adenine37-N6)-methyltransferase